MNELQPPSACRNYYLLSPYRAIFFESKIGVGVAQILVRLQMV